MKSSEYELEKAMNDLAREQMISKLLADLTQDLTQDLTVCNLMSNDPLNEWVIYLKKKRR